MIKKQKNLIDQDEFTIIYSKSGWYGFALAKECDNRDLLMYMLIKKLGN